MTARASALAQVQLTTTAAEIYAVPTGGIPTEVTRLVIANTSAAMVSVDLHHDIAGSAAFNASNALMLGKQIAANDTLIFESASEDTGITLRPGERLGAAAGTASVVTVTIYGVTARTTVAPLGQKGRA